MYTKMQNAVDADFNAATLKVVAVGNEHPQTVDAHSDAVERLAECQRILAFLRLPSVISWNQVAKVRYEIPVRFPLADSGTTGEEDEKVKEELKAKMLAVKTRRMLIAEKTAIVPSENDSTDSCVFNQGIEEGMTPQTRSNSMRPGSPMQELANANVVRPSVEPLRISLVSADHDPYLKPRRERGKYKRELETPVRLVAQSRDTNLDGEILRGLITQNVLEHVLRVQKRIVSFLLSSTFTDTAWERNLLIDDVIPYLQEYSQHRNFEIKLVEMRWGIRKEASDAHKTSEICMAELARAQRESQGYFYVFLGCQKYGYRPFPSKIPKPIYDKLYEASRHLSREAREHCVEIEGKKQNHQWLLDQHYQLDTNVYASHTESSSSGAVQEKAGHVEDTMEAALEDEWEGPPGPVYVLRSQQDFPPGIWWDRFVRLQAVLREASLKVWKNLHAESSNEGEEEESVKRSAGVLRDPSSQAYVKRFFISVTEEEFSRGLLWRSQQEQQFKTLIFKRTFADLERLVQEQEHLPARDKVANLFIDMIESKLDTEAVRMLREQIEMAPSHVDCISYPELNYAPDEGLDPKNDPAHRSYLRKFLDDFCDKMMQSIHAAARRLAVEPDPIVDEATHHLRFAMERALKFKSTKSTSSCEKIVADFLERGKEQKEGMEEPQKHPSIIYACWAYKRGGGKFSSAYKKRYFVITAEQRLNYYKDLEQYYKNTEQGWLSCIGIIVKESHRTETIEKKECFAFTIQARKGSRTDELECACATNDEREKFLAAIENINTDFDLSKAFVIHGPSGAGKTYLVSKIMHDFLHKTAQGRDGGVKSGVAVIRFLGTTPNSSSAWALLTSLCEQLKRVYSKHDVSIPREFNDLKDLFRSAVTTWPSENNPLTLFIDSVDQLDDTNDGRRLDWLPMHSLPKYLRLVISTLPDHVDRFQCFSILKNNVGMNNTVEVQVISEHREVLLSLLQRQGRTLTQEQLDAISQHFKAHDDAKSRQAPKKLKQGLLGTTFKDLTHLAQTVIDTVEDMSGVDIDGDCMVAHHADTNSDKAESSSQHKTAEGGTPLWLTIVAQTASSWTSYDGLKHMDSAIKPDVRGLIIALFGRLVKDHGEYLVKATLAYITIAKFGVSETELNHLCSCEDDVLADVYEWWLPPVRILPPLLITRVLTDLEKYLQFRGEGSTAQLIKWYHRQFWESAEDWLFPSGLQASKRKRIQRHVELADFFGGRWAKVNKPYNERLKKQVYIQHPITKSWLVEKDKSREYDRLLNDGKLRQGEESADRMVPAQPIILRGNIWKRDPNLQLNIRRLHELVHHLTIAGEIERVKKELVSLEYIAAKIKIGHAANLLREYDLAIKLFPRFSKEFRFCKATVGVGLEDLSRLPSTYLLQWVGQQPECHPLCIAAQPMIADDTPLFFDWMNKPVQIDPCSLILVEDSSVNAVAFEESGSYFAYASSNNENNIKILDQISGELKMFMTSHEDDGDRRNAVRSIAVSGTQCVTAGLSGNVRIWSSTTGAQNYEMKELIGTVINAVGFSCDGSWLAAAGEDCKVGIYECQGNDVWIFSRFLDGTKIISSLAWHPTVPEYLVVGEGGQSAKKQGDLLNSKKVMKTGGRTAVVWNARSGKKTTAIMQGHDGTNDCVCGVGGANCPVQGHTGDLLSVAWSHDGKLVATGSADHTVRLWESSGNPVLLQESEEKKIWCTQKGNAGINCVAIAPDGHRVASAGDDKNITLWNIHNAQMLSVMTGHDEWVYSLAWSPDSCMLASGSKDKTLRLWDLTTEESLKHSVQLHDQLQMQDIVDLGARLRITVLRAKDLVASDWGGTSDPYVRLHLGSETFKTSVKKKTVDPVWNECFDFNVAQLDGTLRVECFDQDMLIDESLGKFDVELASLRLEDGQVSRYHPLKEAARKVENKGQIELKYELINNEAQNQDKKKMPGSFKGGLFGKMTAFTGKNMTAVVGKMTALKDLIGDAVETMEENFESMTEKLELRDLADSAVQRMQTAAGAAVSKMEDFAQIASGAAGIFGLMDGPELQVPSMFGVASKTGLSQNHREQNHRGTVIEIRIIQDKELIRTTDYDGKSCYWTFHGEPALVEQDSNLDVQYFQQGESQRQIGDYYLFLSEDRLMVYLVTRDTMRRFRGSADGTRRTPDKGSRIGSADGSRKTPDKGSRTGNLANIPPICEGVAFFKSPSPIKTIEVKDLMFFAGCQSGKVIFCRLLHSDVDRCIPETGDYMMDLFEAPVLSRPNTSGELLHLRSYSHVTKYRPWTSRKSESTDETDKTRRTSNFQMAAFDNDGEITSFLEGSNDNEGLIQWTGGISIPQYVQNNDGTFSRPVTRSKLRPSTSLGNTNFSTLTYDPVEKMPGPKFPLKQDLRLHTCTLCYFRDKLSAKDFREGEGEAESRHEGGLGPLTSVRNRLAKTKTESLLTPILPENAKKMSTSQISLLLASMRAEMMSEKNRNFRGNARREHEAGMKQGDGEMTEDMSTNEPPITALRTRNFIEETKTKFLNFVEETRMRFEKKKLPLSVQESPNRRRGSSFLAMHSRGSSQGSNSCNSTSKDSLLRNFSMAETVRLQVKSREGGGSERARVGAGKREGEGEKEKEKEKEKERVRLLALAVELNGLLKPDTRQARESDKK